MAELSLRVDCPVEGCTAGKILVPAEAMTAVWPSRLGHAVVELRPDNDKLLGVILDHFAEHHTDLLDDDVKDELRLTESDVDQLLGATDG